MKQLLFFLSFVFLFKMVQSQGIITTVAGKGIYGFSGDGGMATAANLYNPKGMAVDAAGNLFIADTHNNRIRKVSPAGIISTVAGTDNEGFSGDGGLASAASLSSPKGVAVDVVGNLFIADGGNNRIRKVNTAGIISTVAGNGNYGFFGDGSAANVASLANPSGVAVDAAGNLFIADADNSRIRKVSPAGIISTVAGNGYFEFSGDGGAATAAGINAPLGVAVNAAGNIFIADYHNFRVRKVSPTGIISTVAGNGQFDFSGDGADATAASIAGPTGVAVDAAGNVFISDNFNNRIRKVSPTGIINTVAGGGYAGDGTAATSASIGYPDAVTIDAVGNLFIVDGDNNRIRKVNTAGIISTIAGNITNSGFSGDGGAATAASLNNPQGVAVDAVGNLFIVDGSNNRIRKVSTAGIISTVAGNGVAGFSGDGGAATAASLNYPNGVAVDAVGNLFIVDGSNNRIRKVNTAGIISTVAGNGVAGFSGDGGAATAASLNYPNGVAVDAVGNLFIVDEFNYRIRKVSTAGIISTVVGNGAFGFSGDGAAATAASLRNVNGITIDVSGNLFFSDGNNQRIRKVNPAGIISTVAGNGNFDFSGDGGMATAASLNYPFGVAVDVSGNLFFSDINNQRIRKVSPAGIISTVAGNGYSGFNGDGRAATSTRLYSPNGVAVDAAGNLYISDAENDRIRKVIFSPVVTSFFPKQASSGKTITINGHYFSSATIVSFGGTLATSFKIVNDSTITAVVGNGASGSVAVTNPGGKGSLNGFIFCLISPATVQVAFTGCNSVLYNAKTYTTSTIVRDTIRSKQGGCDSIYTIATLTIKITPKIIQNPLSGCVSLVFRNKTYTNNSTIRDTLRTTTGCDSVYTINTITINPKPYLGKDTLIKICKGSSANLTKLYSTTGNSSIIWSTKRPDSVGKSKDTLIVTTAAGCKDTAIVTVDTLSVPAKPIITQKGNLSFCLNDSLVLTTTATGPYQWLRNGNAIKNAINSRYVVRISGGYKLRVTNGVGCSTISDSVIVSTIQVAKPVITLVNDTLVSSATAGNKWYFNGVLIVGATASKYSPNELGGYTVQVTTGNCVSPLSDTYIYTANTFAKKGTSGFYLKLYPNPASTTTSLQISGVKTKVQITLTDLAGKKIWLSEKMSNGVVNIPIQNLASGTYLVTVAEGAFLKTLKLVKGK